ncbi:MAG: Poly(A) polymerase (EC [uncultured Thiotrichaceae bacterium]|uniref:Poly(A) polymerase I n=1 Tax=uncultured Thiotrichaceae bacterium TaxID=298394 RepID=A0A6S6T0M9_9GAMM|nr:MAG: Poly(A) polymerase (EC [uncultured Thiotrichaceae bacterium]
MKPEQPIVITASDHHIKAEKICSRSLGIIKKLQKAGHEAYLVGGCVRDLLLDHEPKDFDIATSALPEQVRKLFSSARLIGRRFRLAHIHFGRDYLEVATFRAPHDEGAGGQVNAQGRIIHDNVYGTLEEDAWRRDFTINALYYNPVNGEILDFVGGLADLEKRHISLIGDPEQRYREDPVRMMRALRFAAKLDCKITGDTEALILPMASLLGAVAPARLFDEMLKLLHSGYGLKSFRLLDQYGVLEYLLPVTVKSLKHDQDGQFKQLLESALQNTDNRIAEGKSVMPPFLYAILLWDEVSRLKALAQEEGHPEMQALNIAATDVLRKQVQHTAIPKRFSNITREIWTLQPRFHSREQRRANALFNNIRFRAAYDFLVLRAQSGEPVSDESQWWTTFQEVTAEERLLMYSKTGKRRKKRRPRKKTGT